MSTSLVAGAEGPIQFNRDVRPILSDHCFSCHGPDTRKLKAGFRLDVEKSAKGEADSGARPIVPGNASKSEILTRIHATDSTVMPPKSTDKPLTAQQKATLKRWIEQGAPWEDHWSFTPIKRAQPPAVKGPVFIKHPIDRFIQVKLNEQGLSPLPRADRVTLIRRLTFDLTGLPPTPEKVQAFVEDSEETAYDKVVTRLLASPRFGERMAMFWLDLARYADSVGYHGDQPVSVWPYRDYVIRSFNENKPFDQFTLEQLAGDLFPNPTLEQKIASGYNRLGMMSAEGGVQPKEYLAKYIAERVRAVGGAWLGLTTGCAECHDHKFDPISTRDFYRLEAFFADIQEQGLYNGNNFGSSLPIITNEQQQKLDALKAEVLAAQTNLNAKAVVTEENRAKLEAEARKTKLDNATKKLLDTPADKRTEPQKIAVTEFLKKFAVPEADRAQLTTAQKQLADFEKTLPTTLITVPVKPRTIRVLARGNWMDDTGEIVEPGTPESLPQLPKTAHRLTRLDLAKWLVAPENPLTARVLMNRLWKLFHGAGLSRKLDDLGSQGEAPTHPELLDYLASRLIESQWNIKQMIRILVTSETYQRSSLVTEALREKDPFNLWLARQGRWRLDAEMVRDNALAISGLLSPKMGGPSAKPYQPPGYWSFLNFPRREWQNDTGENLYRRGVYVHWQRQYLHPSLMAFDAPSREECTADRVRSNTPLQSLVLLNAPEYVESARAFAELLLAEENQTDAARLNRAFLRAVNRPIRDAERDLLLELLADQRKAYASKPDDAKTLVTQGAKPITYRGELAELAAWTNITRTILNLHATMTRN